MKKNKCNCSVTEPDLVKALLAGKTDNDTKISVDGLQALSDAEFLMNSDHFLRCLQDIQEKYTQALTRGDIDSDPDYLKHSQKLMAVKEFLNALLAPIAIDN